MQAKQLLPKGLHMVQVSTNCPKHGVITREGNYFIRHDLNDLSWYCNMPDVYHHMRHQGKKYATFYHLGVTELPARYSYYGNGAYQPCIFTAMGVNGGVIAGASMMTTPLVMDVNAKLDYDFEQYPQHPAIMMADVTDLPFPYHA